MFTSDFSNSYEWLVTDADSDLLELCPEIVLGKYVAKELDSECMKTNLALFLPAVVLSGDSFSA